MSYTQPTKQPPAPFSLANLCCYAGIGLVVYGMFQIHQAAGFMTAGSGLIVVGALLKRG